MSCGRQDCSSASTSRRPGILQRLLKSRAFIPPHGGQSKNLDATRITSLRHVLVVLDTWRPFPTLHNAADFDMWHSSALLLARSSHACVRHSASWLLLASLKDWVDCAPRGIQCGLVEDYGETLLALMRPAEASQTRAVAARAVGCFARLAASFQSLHGPSSAPPRYPGAGGAGVVSRSIPLLVGIAGAHSMMVRNNSNRGFVDGGVTPPYSPTYAAHALHALVEIINGAPRDAVPFGPMIERCCISHFLHETCAATRSRRCIRAAANCYANLHKCWRFSAERIPAAAVAEYNCRGESSFSSHSVSWQRSMLQAVAAADKLTQHVWLGVGKCREPEGATGIRDADALYGCFSPLVSLGVDSAALLHRVMSLCECLRELLGQTLHSVVRIPVTRILVLVDRVIGHRPDYGRMWLAPESEGARILSLVHQEALALVEMLIWKVRRNLLPWLSKVSRIILRGIRSVEINYAGALLCHLYEASFRTARLCVDVFGPCALRFMVIPLVPFVCAVLTERGRRELGNTQLGRRKAEQRQNGRDVDDLAPFSDRTLTAAAETAHAIIDTAGCAMPQPLLCQLYHALVRSVSPLGPVCGIGDEQRRALCRRVCLRALFSAVSTCGALGVHGDLFSPCLSQFSGACTDTDACTKDGHAGVLLCQSLLSARRK